MKAVTRTLAPHHAANDDLAIVADGDLPLTSEGIYDAVGGHAHRPRIVFKVLKLYIPFIVLVPNPGSPNGFEHVRMFRHYRVHPAPDRRFLVRASSDYYREWVIATGRRPSRHDRLSPEVFERVLFAVQVHTVRLTSRQVELPVGARYSVISRVIERKAGGGAQL